MRAQQVVLAILLCLVCAGVTFAQSAPALPPLQPAQTSPAKSCAEYAVPQQIVASKTQGNGYLYSSVCVRPYKPDLEYAKNQTPVGETRDGFSQRNADPLFIIQMAYGRDVGEVLNVPDWLSAEAYDFEAKMDPATADALEKLSPDNRQLARQRMLQTLLEDQFNLEVHKEMRKIAAYDLIVAEGGPNFMRRLWIHDIPTACAIYGNPARTQFQIADQVELTT
jgi:Protein of unknown function (DUF3738)